MPPPSHKKEVASPSTPYVPPIIPGEPHTKFLPKKLMVLILFCSCLGVITFAVWLGGR